MTVSSRAKCAALLKLLIRVDRDVIAERVSSRAKCAALLKRILIAKVYV